MNFLDGLIAPPRADHVHIAKYFVIVLSLFFIPYISILFGSTLFSLGFSFRGRRENNSLFWKFGKDIAETLMGGVPAGLVLGILPILAFAISFAQILYGTDANISQYFMYTLVFVILTVIVTQIFKKSFSTRDQSFNSHLFWGVVALFFQHLTIYGYVSSICIILFPEKWPLVTTAIPLPFDWNMLARFGMFMNGALAITGVAILFFFFNWMGGKEGMDDRYKDYVKKFGGGVALGLTMAQTLFMVWFLATLPVMAKSSSVYLFAVVGTIILLIMGYYLYSILKDSKLKYGTHVSVLLVIFLVVFMIDENTARENALLYQNYALEKIEEDLLNEVEAKRLESAGVEGASAELGEQIFNQKCSACHRFETQLVGPAYLEVLPKYNGDVEALKKFILNPVKVNPNLPAMPNQGLKPNEAESAALFLLKHAEELKKNH